MTADQDLRQTVLAIKDAADIVDIIGSFVKLHKSGANFKGLCPFHSEKTPSFMVNRERGSFHCFGCSEGGDAITFLMKYHRMTFPEAVRDLARRYNIPVPERETTAEDHAVSRKRETLFEANQKAAVLFHDFLLKERDAAPARAYLQKRGVPASIIESFRLGFAPDRWDFLMQAFRGTAIAEDIAHEAGLLVRNENGRMYDRFRNRVMFPILGITGKVLGFGGRIIGDGQPKYLNSPETSVFDKGRTLFGLYQGKEAIRKTRRCVIVEGNFDLISLVAHGLTNVVAPLGTALTQAHVRTLKGYADEVFLLFDGDTAGLKAAMRAVGLFLAEHLAARVAVLPEGMDPDTFILKNGRAALDRSLEAAHPLAEFVFDRLVEQHGLTIDGKGRILEELAPLLTETAATPLQHSVLVSHFSQRLGLAPEQMLAGMKPTGTPRPLPAKKKKAGPLPQREKRFLELLLFNPEYFEDFMAEGLIEHFGSATGASIIKQMALLRAEQPAAGWDALLDALSDPLEKALLAELLFVTPSYSEEIKAAMAKDMLTQLKKSRLKAEKELLLQRIHEAQDAQDESLLTELLRQKIAIDKILASGPHIDGPKKE